MREVFLILAEEGVKSGTILMILIAIAIVAITGYFLLKKKKQN